MSKSWEIGNMDATLEPSPLPGTIAEAAYRLRTGTLTATDLARACLEGIARLEHRLKAFITVTEDEALEAAETLEAELKQGKDRGPLHGIPIVHKDLYDTAGVLTTIGSELFRQRVPREDATVVRKLKVAGTVMLGKTNLSEFAAGTSGTNRAFGDTANPWDLARSAGGSSSGTAAAVAAGLCLGGTGSDTGGSIRIPASWSGIVGLRPTFGLVSLHGCHPRAYSLDCGGPLARTVADVAILLNAMVGYDPRYRHSIRAPKVDYTAHLGKGVKGLRLGIVEGYTFRDVDQEVGDAIQAAADRLAELGAQVKTVGVPVLNDPAGHSSLLDVLLYEFNQILGAQYRAIENKEEMFEPIVRANILRGEAISRETYEKLLAERPKRMAAMKVVFREVDALLTPTTPTVAPPLDADPEVFDRARRFNLPVSFLGLPALSVPCGFSAAGLPIGLQLVADTLQEALLLRIAAAYEEATRFYRRRPSVHIAREPEAYT
ncbi:amidase [Pelomicrobium sp.]|jgi:aspartyl-tRNA(Asn)/glutamyl-tRNA(Gln) amidotransferase subunit A|uniref:amidase n=1 Tax=Pelomicrobium sp. TaxID=2815319 RepID=UPI002FDD2387